MTSGMGCFVHPEEQAVAACKRCGKALCRGCIDLYSKSGEKHVGLCRDCVVAVGIECGSHTSKQAVVLCRDCGKGICRDCYDSYGAGIGAGKALCFECTERMVQKHLFEINEFRSVVKGERTWMIIGAVIGSFLLAYWGSNQPASNAGTVIIFWILGAFIGASIGTIIISTIKAGFSSGKEEGMGTGCVVAVISALGMLLISPIMSIYRFFKRNKQIKQANAIIASDERILQEIRAYFAYTQVLEKNAGADIAKLVSGELSGNAYAQAVLNQGEKAAQEELRKGVNQIDANGEIIDSFNKRK